MKEKTVNTIIIITCVIMVIIAGLITYWNCFNNKVYVTKYVNSETGVCYLLTNNSIIEMHNPDGTLHTEKASNN